jgi:hypothetical protein
LVAGSSPGQERRTRGAAALSDVLRHGPSQGVVDTAEAAMRAMRLGRSTHEWLTCAVSALLFADRTEAAAAWCDHWLAEARGRRVPLWIAEFSSLRAGIALRQGRPREARALAEAALARISVESWGVCIGGPLANLIQANTDLGDRDAAAEYLEVPLPPGLFDSRFGLYYLHARGHHNLATEQPRAALDDFANCGSPQACRQQLVTHRWPRCDGWSGIEGQGIACVRPTGHCSAGAGHTLRAGAAIHGRGICWFTSGVVGRMAGDD